MAETELRERIVELVLECIASGAVDRNKVRQIIVGPSRDGQSINIWQEEKWDGYMEPEDSQAIAQICNDDWLSRVDRIGFFNDPPADGGTAISPYLPDTGVQFADPALQRRYLSILAGKINEIKSALETIASQQLLGAFPRLVGLMGMRLSKSSDADLICFYHPLGVDILPAKERRLPGYSSIYGWMSLTDDGLMHFYPEGAADDEAETSADSGEQAFFTHYRFSDMDCFYLERNEVVFQLSSSGQQIEFDCGHTHEEWGGPDRTEVSDRLVAHFKNGAPHLYFDPAQAPPSGDSNGSRWLELYAKSAKKQPSLVVRNALDRGDPGAAETFISSQTLTEKELSAVDAEYVAYDLRIKDYLSAIARFRKIHSPRWNVWNGYYRSMAMLGMFDDIYRETEAELEKAKPDSDEYETHACFHVLAGFHLGQSGDYEKTLAGIESPSDDHVYSVARALVVRGNTPLCREALVRALRDRSYLPEYAEADFSAAPELLPLVRDLLHMREDLVLLDERPGHLSTTGMLPGVESEILHPLDHFLNRWGSGQRLQRLRKGEEAELEPEFHRQLSRDKNGALVKTKKGISRAEGHSGTLILTEILEDGEDYRAVVAQGRTLYAATGRCLKVFHETEGGAPVLQSSTFLLGADSPDSIALSGGTLAVGSHRGLEIFAVRDGADPARLGLVSLSSVLDERAQIACILFRDGVLYAAFDGKGCAAIDLTDVTHPRLRGFVHADISITDLAEREGHVALLSKAGACFVDFTNIAEPVLVRSLRLSTTGEFLMEVPERQALTLVGGDNEYCWYEIRYDGERRSIAFESWPIFESEVVPTNLYYVKTLLPCENGYVVCQDDQWTTLQFEEMPVYQPVSDEERKQGRQALASWIHDRMGEFADSGRQDAVGHVHFEAYLQHREDFRLFLDGQRSLPGIHLGPIGQQAPDAFEVVGYEGDRAGFAGLSGKSTARGGGALQDWQSRLLMTTAEEVCRGALLDVADTETFKKIAPGKVYLTSNIGTGIQVFAMKDNGGSWTPWRRSITGVVELALTEILEDSGKWAAYADKCDENAQLKEELYALARSGDEGALQVVRRRLNREEDASVDVLLDVIVNKGQSFWLLFLDRLVHRPDVKEACSTVYDRLLPFLAQSEHRVDDWAGALIEVAIMLGHQDREELDPLVDRLLNGSPDYRDYDLVIKLLNARTDIHGFAETIQKAIAAMHERDNRLPDLAEQLFRAGVTEIPHGLLLQSAPEKQGEQYGDMKIGIKALDQKMDQYDQCRIERLFTGRMVLDRFRKFSESDDATSPLYPEALKPEPWPSSWKYLTASILSQMDREAELEPFIRALAIRLPLQQHTSDRAIFQALFQIMIESQDYPRIRMMGDIVRSLSASESLAPLNALRTSAEINIAWKANEEGDVRLSREVTDGLLAEGVESPHVYFLDARLKWKESGNPGAAIEIGEKYIGDMHGGPGRARLHNLMGCAHDELKDYEKAVQCFLKAADEDPETLYHFDNLAEAYDKMGETAKASEWAGEARRRGSKAAILDVILGRSAPVSEAGP